MVYDLYRETGDARSASPLVANVALPHRVYQWVASAVDQILTRDLNRPQFAPSIPRGGKYQDAH